MKKKLLITVSLFSMSATSISFADEIPFQYNYKLDGFVSGITSVAMHPSHGKAACHIAIDKPSEEMSTVLRRFYHKYHYSMSGEACATARLAFMSGQPVYLWAMDNGPKKNLEAIAIEMVNGTVFWQIDPKKK